MASFNVILVRPIDYFPPTLYTVIFTIIIDFLYRTHTGWPQKNMPLSLIIILNPQLWLDF